ncbi:MAG: primosomal protein N', partial [Lactobacillales bacterium]|nr:primosomal protein N' [Lactobacillales bacterium]
MQRLTVLFPAPLGCYDYLADEKLAPGSLIRAPFGRKSSVGAVWDAPPDLSLSAGKIKPIKEVIPYALPPQSVKFINWVSKYTLSPLGSILKMALIPDFEKQSKKPLVFEQPDPAHQKIHFSPEQQTAVTHLTDKLAHGFSTTLLDGVTGSGKTEVYFEMIAHALASGGQVLVLLPEIILTNAWIDRFAKRFGTPPALWHSSLTEKQRRDTWQSILNNTAKVIVGARSALFLPFADLRLIVIDEEHDASFKQEEGILYHARDMAIVRAQIGGCPIVLSSATPSIETYANVVSKKYDHVILPERFQGALYPDIHIIDMRQKEKGPLRFVSPKLEAEIGVRLAKKEQSLLFLNRRGYAPMLLCRSCGDRLSCPNCSVYLTYHQKKDALLCHHCGYTVKRPDTCPACKEDALVACGPGVERIHEELQTYFPGAKINVVTS